MKVNNFSKESKEAKKLVFCKDHEDMGKKEVEQILAIDPLERIKLTVDLIKRIYAYDDKIRVVEKKIYFYD